MSRFFLAPAFCVALLVLCAAHPWVTSAQKVPAGDSLAAILSSEASVYLRDVLAQVAEANPVLRASRLDAEALGTRKAQVAAWPDPTIGVTYQPLPVLTARGAQRTQWRVEQPIPYPGKLRLQGTIADLSADVAGHEADVLAADLALEAKQAYYELYRVQQTEVLIRDFQGELRSFEEAAAVRYEVGAGTQQAILKAQLEKNGLAQRLLDLRERRRRAAEKLARLTNRPGSARALQTTPLARPNVPDLELARLLSVATEERPEVAALEAAAEQATWQVELAQRQFWPDVGLSLSYFDIAETDVPPSATGRDAVGVGISVKVPLQRGRLHAQLEEARLRQAQVEVRQEALQTELQTQIEDLLYALEQEAQTLDLYDETLLPQAATTVEATLSAYTTGRTDFLNLLDAERTLFALHTGYEDAFFRYLETAARLERALGITALDDLDVHEKAADASIPKSSSLRRRGSRKATALPIDLDLGSSPE